MVLVQDILEVGVLACDRMDELLEIVRDVT
jgi:hypothetical protein